VVVGLPGVDASITLPSRPGQTIAALGSPRQSRSQNEADDHWAAHRVHDPSAMISAPAAARADMDPAPSDLDGRWEI
jgi:hypothetical protein